MGRSGYIQSFFVWLTKIHGAVNVASVDICHKAAFKSGYKFDHLSVSLFIPGKGQSGPGKNGDRPKQLLYVLIRCSGRNLNAHFYSLSDSTSVLKYIFSGTADLNDNM